MHFASLCCSYNLGWHQRSHESHPRQTMQPNPKRGGGMQDLASLYSLSSLLISSLESINYTISGQKRQRRHRKSSTQPGGILDSEKKLLGFHQRSIQQASRRLLIVHIVQVLEGLGAGDESASNETPILLRKPRLVCRLEDGW